MTSINNSTVTVRLPSFNDFSPGLFKKDLRPVLAAVANHPGDDEAVFAELESGVCKGWDRKRVRTNVAATLGSTGLTAGRPFVLTPFGQRVLSASSAQEAAVIFCTELIKDRNGLKVIEAIRNLTQRGDRVTKASLQTELQRIGVSGLANDTTDHFTLKNWMIEAGFIVETKQGFPVINDTSLKTHLGISSGEHNEIQSLTPAQSVFLQLLRRRHLTEKGPFSIHDLYTECRTTTPHAFSSANLAQSVKEPLSEQGWITVSAATGKGRGGKSGFVVGTKKLLSIPIQRFVPDFDAGVPPDLRAKLQTPSSQIRDWLTGTDTHKGGLGLELLALRIILDLRLNPRGFRCRSKETAYAEVDLTAEGNHLLFSRWTFQCKRIQANKNVGLGDVAKEVGIAIYMKAHVVAMVSTGGFSSEALSYAREVTNATNLQFLFLDGKILRAYLAEGPQYLHKYVMENAAKVLAQKRSQPILPA